MSSCLRPTRIVVALDASEYAEIVLEHALDQAARHAAVALHFVTVADAASHDLAMQRLVALVAGGLETLAAASATWTSQVHVLCGRPVEEIASFTADVDADLLVIGRFGPDPARILSLVACPTLVVGLGAHEVETNPQCPACVDVRAATDGERWFCADHAATGRFDLSLRLPPSTTSPRGGGVW